MTFPGGAGGKEAACFFTGARGAGSTPGSGRSPGGGHGNPLQYSCRGNIPRTEEPDGLQPRVGCKESDMTEHKAAKK